MVGFAFLTPLTYPIKNLTFASKKKKKHNIWLNFVTVHPACNWNCALSFILGTADGKIHYGNLNL